MMSPDLIVSESVVALPSAAFSRDMVPSPRPTTVVVLSTMNVWSPVAVLIVIESGVTAVTVPRALLPFFSAACSLDSEVPFAEIPVRISVAFIVAGS
jgi:hypothetical protein